MNENKKMRKLSLDEISEVSGGWEYDGNLKWLKGHNIVCQRCGSNTKEVVQYKFSLNNGLTAIFQCSNCNHSFAYLYQNGEILKDENPRFM